MSTRSDAIEIFHAAITAVQPSRSIPEWIQLNKGQLVIGDELIDRSQFSGIYVVGAGKAAAAMAQQTEKILGTMIRDGIVVTKYGHSLPLQRIRCLEAAHPVPDEQSVNATGKTIELLRSLKDSDLLICLVSGGASSLWCDLPGSLSLEDIRKTFDLLVHSGASIHEMNCVRKHLSAFKGGQLPRYCPGTRIITLVISDVPGDDPGTIASGPTVADTTSFADAWAVLENHGLHDKVPLKVRDYLRKGIEGRIPDTPKPGDAGLRHTTTHIIASNKIALEAAAVKAGELGYEVVLKKELVEDDTEKAAGTLVHESLAYAGKRPACILWGGETTLKVTGTGMGGRNQHFVLSALDQLLKNSSKNITILSGGTDGTDGPTDATGAIIDNETNLKAQAKFQELSASLQNHDAYNFLKPLDSLIITGPTQTNVMDIMISIVE